MKKNIALVAGLLLVSGSILAQGQWGGTVLFKAEAGIIQRDNGANVISDGGKGKAEDLIYTTLTGNGNYTTQEELNNSDAGTEGVISGAGNWYDGNVDGLGGVSVKYSNTMPTGLEYTVSSIFDPWAGTPEDNTDIKLNIKKVVNKLEVNGTSKVYVGKETGFISLEGVEGYLKYNMSDKSYVKLVKNYTPVLINEVNIKDVRTIATGKAYETPYAMIDIDKAGMEYSTAVGKNSEVRIGYSGGNDMGVYNGIKYSSMHQGFIQGKTKVSDFEVTGTVMGRKKSTAKEDTIAGGVVSGTDSEFNRAVAFGEVSGKIGKNSVFFSAIVDNNSDTGIDKLLTTGVDVDQNGSIGTAYGVIDETAVKVYGRTDHVTYDHRNEDANEKAKMTGVYTGITLHPINQYVDLSLKAGYETWQGGKYDADLNKKSLSARISMPLYVEPTMFAMFVPYVSAKYQESENNRYTGQWTSLTSGPTSYTKDKQTRTSVSAGIEFSAYLF